MAPLGVMLDCPCMSRRSDTRRLTWVLAVSALAALVFAGFDSLWLAYARNHQPTGSAQWISGRRMEAPVAYYLVKDFAVDGDLTEAELQILADEAYTAHLNGNRIGSNRYRAHAPVDRYRVEDFLRQGSNRIAVLVDLTRMRGGLVARIVAPEEDGERELVVSDDSWLVLPELPGPTFSRPDHQLRPLPRARAIGYSPRGRWGWLQLGPLRTVLEDQLLMNEDGTPARTARARSWRDQSGRSRRLGRGARNRRLGDWVEFSWNKPQVGYLSVRYGARRPPVGLVYFGMEPPNPAVDAPDLILVGVDRRSSWQDAVVRRFRHVLVVGVPSVIDAEVHRVRIAESEIWDPSTIGVLGIQPPPAGTRLRSAVEDEIWRRVQRVPRGTGG